MKNKAKSLCRILVFISFAFINANQLFGQKKMTFSAGVGFPELINIGIKYQILDQTRIGLSVGWWPPSSSTGILRWGNLISLSGDFYYHFAGSSEFSELRPWYGRIGLNCIPEQSLWDSYLRIGRAFNLDKNFGISLDAGLLYHFNYKTTGISSIISALGVCCFYQF